MPVLAHPRHVENGAGSRSHMALEVLRLDPFIENGRMNAASRKALIITFCLLDMITLLLLLEALDIITLLLLLPLSNPETPNQQPPAPHRNPSCDKQ